jgi:lysophospholipase L1-like esterase
MIDIAVRIALFPLLAAQGMITRRRAVFLPVAAGRQIGVTGTGPDLHMLVLGDSSAAGVGASHQEEALLGHMRKRLVQTNTVHWEVDAVIGATTADTLKRLQDRPASKFDVVSVSLGVNDVTKLVPLPVWLHRQEALMDLLRDKFGAEVICVSGVPKMGLFPLLPQPLRWVLGCQADRFDRNLRALVASRAECRFIEMDFDLDTSFMSADGFHPGPKIYSEWGRKVYGAVRDDVRALRDKFKGRGGWV